MKTRTANLLVPLFGGSATSVFAADGPLQSADGLLVWFFLGFCALVIMAQAIPAIVLLYSMVKALFTSSETASAADSTRSGL